MKTIFTTFTAILFIAMFAVISNGQTLSKAFKNYETVTANPTEMVKSIKEGKIVQFGRFKLRLESFDLVKKGNLQAKNSKSQSTIATFKGTIEGESRSFVRLTVGKTILGMIAVGNDYLYIDSANKYQADLSKDVYVLYRTGSQVGQQHTLQEPALTVADPIPALNSVINKYKSGNDQSFNFLPASYTAPKLAPASPRNLTIELTFDVDQYFIAQHGSTSNARFVAYASINNASGIMESELGVRIVLLSSDGLVFPNEALGPAPCRPGTCSPTEAELEAQAGAYIEKVRVAYNTYYPRSTYGWDAALNFTNRFESPYYGSFYQFDLGGGETDGTICNTFGDYAVGFVQSRILTFDHLSRVVAHELAHGLSDRHSDAQVPGETCINRNSFTVSQEIHPPGTPFFCPSEVTRISNYLAKPQFAADGGCLAPPY